MKTESMEEELSSTKMEIGMMATGLMACPKEKEE